MSPRAHSPLGLIAVQAELLGGSSGALLQENVEALSLPKIQLKLLFPEIQIMTLIIKWKTLQSPYSQILYSQKMEAIKQCAAHRAKHTR